LDQALGGLGRKLAEKADARIFAAFREKHHLSLFQPEEDEWLLFHIMSSAFFLFAFSSPDAVMHLVRFDEAAEPAQKKRIMEFHKRCLQRHLYFHGAEKRILSKNPTFSAKVDSIDSTYPDSKIVCCVRNPYEAVPSLMSLLSFILELTDNTGDPSQMRDVILSTAAHFYRHPMARLPHLPEGRHDFVTYDKLTTEPKETVTNLYAKFGLDMGFEYAEQLEVEQTKIRSYKSKHSYSLEEYDLDPEGLLEEFRDVFDRYGFSKEYPT
jgi:omega-hydroxy-beta-dihydromenaquinone-9 sulfotransferase